MSDFIPGSNQQTRPNQQTGPSQQTKQSGVAAKQATELRRIPEHEASWLEILLDNLSRLSTFLWVLIIFGCLLLTLIFLGNRDDLRLELRRQIPLIRYQLDDQLVRDDELLPLPPPTIITEDSLLQYQNQDFLQLSPYGYLPKRNQANSPAYSAYRHPEVARGGKPGLAIVIVELGFNKQSQGWAQVLPTQVNFAYSSFSPDIAENIRIARNLGHEVLLDFPVSAPDDETIVDSGPIGINFNNSEQLRPNLLQMLATATGYIGVRADLAKQLGSYDQDVAGILGELEQRGLIYFDRTDSGNQQLKQQFATALIPVNNLTLTLTGNTPAQLQAAFDELIANSSRQQYISWYIPAYRAILIKLHEILATDPRINTEIVLIPLSQILTGR